MVYFFFFWEGTEKKWLLKIELFKPIEAFLYNTGEYDKGTTKFQFFLFFLESSTAALQTNWTGWNVSVLFQFLFVLIILYVYNKSKHFSLVSKFDKLLYI